MTTVHYQLTYNEALGTAFRRRVLRPRFWIIQSVDLVVAVALWLAGPPLSYFAFIFAVLALVFPFLLYIAIANRISSTRWVTAPTTLEFDDETLRLSMGDVRNEIRWRAFQRWERGRDHFFLYPGPGPQALTIPVRAFDPAALEHFTGQLALIESRAAAGHAGG